MSEVGCIDCSPLCSCQALVGLASSSPQIGQILLQIVYWHVKMFELIISPFVAPLLCTYMPEVRSYTEPCMCPEGYNIQFRNLTSVCWHDSCPYQFLMPHAIPTRTLQLSECPPQAAGTSPRNDHLHATRCDSSLLPAVLLAPMQTSKQATSA